jgi:hypothetical protein
MKKSAITSGSSEAKGCPEGVTIKKEVLDERTVCEVRPSLSLNVVVKGAAKRNKKNCAIDLARELADHHAMVTWTQCFDSCFAEITSRHDLDYRICTPVPPAWKSHLPLRP